MSIRRIVESPLEFTIESTWNARTILTISDNDTNVCIKLTYKDLSELLALANSYKEFEDLRGAVLYQEDFHEMSIAEFTQWTEKKDKYEAASRERGRLSEIRQQERDKKRKELYQQRLPLYQQWVKLIQAGKFDELSDKEIVELVRELSPTENHRIVFSLPPELRKRFIERKIAIGGGRYSITEKEEKENDDQN